MARATVSANGVAHLSWREACSRRMARHGLLGALDDPAAAAGAMCGAHAQIMSAAQLSVGLRLDGVTRSDVARALWDERTLVKTLGPRGTVHLLPAHELPMWTGALAGVPSASSFAPPLRLDAAQTDAVVAAVGEALARAELTIDELDEAVGAACGDWARELSMPAFGGFWPRWRQAIAAAAHRGVLCFGPNRGRQVTYSDPRRWLRGFVPEPTDSAVRQLVLRYLHSYGPATPAHLAQWLAAPRPWVSSVFESLGAALEQVDLDGTTAFVPAGDTAPVDVAHKGVRLLPYFDAYAVGCHPRSLLFPGRAGERALTDGQAGNLAVVLVDGVVGGVWHQRRIGARIEITVEPLRRLAKSRLHDLEAELARVGAIMEALPELAIGEVTVRPHA